MIHVNAMRTAIDTLESDAVYEENVRYVDQIVANLQLLKQSNNELKSYGIYTEDRDELYEESVGDAVRKIGDSIIAVIDRALNLWSSITGKIKAFVFKGKSEEKQLESIAKKNPTAAEKIKLGIELGNFKMADIKDLNTFYRDLDSICNEIDHMNKADSGIRGKIKHAERKINASEGLKAVSTILGVAAATGTAYLTYKKVINAIRGGEKLGENIMDQGAAFMRKLRGRAKGWKNIKNDNVYKQKTVAEKDKNGNFVAVTKNTEQEVVVSKMHAYALVSATAEKITTQHNKTALRLVTTLTGMLNKFEVAILKKTSTDKNNRLEKKKTKMQEFAAIKEKEAGDSIDDMRNHLKDFSSLRKNGGDASTRSTTFHSSSKVRTKFHSNKKPKSKNGSGGKPNGKPKTDEQFTDGGGI